LNQINAFAQQFARLHQAASKAAFEFRFSAIQKNLIKNLNKEIMAVGEASVVRKVERIQKERDTIFAAIPKLEEYQFNLRTNMGRFLEIQNDAQVALSLEDDNGTFSSNEASAINIAKDAIAEKIRFLVDVNYPGIQDGSLVSRMRLDADRLDKLTAVAGTVEDADATFSNDNRPLLNLLSEIDARSLNFSSSTHTLVYSTNDMLINMEKAVYSKQADLTGITATEISRKTEEIERLKLRYSNMLQAISISFEVSSSLGDRLAEGTQPAPDGGSILNLFV